MYVSFSCGAVVADLIISKGFLQNTVPLIYMSLNNKSIYCDMTRSSKPSDKVDLSGPVFCSCSEVCVSEKTACMQAHRQMKKLTLTIVEHSEPHQSHKRLYSPERLYLPSVCDLPCSKEPLGGQKWLNTAHLLRDRVFVYRRPLHWNTCRRREQLLRGLILAFPVKHISADSFAFQNFQLVFYYGI